MNVHSIERPRRICSLYGAGTLFIALAAAPSGAQGHASGQVIVQHAANGTSGDSSRQSATSAGRRRIGAEQTASNLSGAWVTGRGRTTEPKERHVVTRTPCNYTPGFWELQQDGDTVRATTVDAHRALGIAVRPERPAPLKGRYVREVLTIGNARTGYRLRYDAASGHLRGTFAGAAFWAVPLEIVEPEGCRPVR